MSIPRDLTNKAFGRLTAKEIVRMDRSKGAIWRCECSCGGEKEVPAAYLLNGKTKSCGCLTREIKSKSDITNQRFGLLVAVRFDHTDEKYKPHWLFQCDCGNQKVLPISSVKWGRVRSCGCLAEKHITELNRQDISGMQFDRLTAVRPTDERDVTGSIIWECKCECGNIVKLSVNKLHSGRVHSCGCKYKETRSECTKARKDITDHTSISSLVSSKKVKVNNTSGCTGVYLDKRSGKWNAYINYQKKRYYLGSFKEIESAIRARKEGEERIHDPAIMEHFQNLTPERKKEFIEYMKSIGAAVTLEDQAGGENEQT